MTADAFAGRIAVITGASRGIGKAVAIRLGAMGATCVLIARTVGGLEAADDAIRKAGGKAAVLVPLDLARDHDKIDALGAELHVRYGKIDILVGAAAKLGGLSPIGHIAPETWNDVMAVNVAANYRLLRSLDPLLRQSAAGRALFLTAAAAHDKTPFWGLFAASKAALETLVAAYAAETALTNIRAACVDPGPAATKLRREAFPGIPPETLPSAHEAAEKIIAAL